MNLTLSRETIRNTTPVRTLGLGLPTLFQSDAPHAAVDCGHRVFFRNDAAFQTMAV